MTTKKMDERTKEMLIIASFALRQIDKEQFDGILLDWFLQGRAAIDGILMFVKVETSSQ